MTKPGTPPNVHDERIDGPHGPLTLRIYSPAEPRAGLVWVHGGAFAFGDIDMPESDWVARELAKDGITVVTVDYQLAPLPASAARWGEPRGGVHFPVASDEVTAAYLWATSSSAILAPADGWSLGGASAGANLAAGAALRLRDESKDPQPRSLVLAYPLVHAVLPEMSTELAEKAAALPAEERFEPSAVDEISLNYAGDDSVLRDPYAFPGGAELRGLAPTLIINSDHDTLRASGEEFARQLEHAAVTVDSSYEEGTRHGHLNNPDDPGAARTIERIRRWLA